MSNFVPDQPKVSREVPFYDDVRAADGWQGQATGKSIETLKSEIVTAISLMGGLVSGFVKGNFQTGDQKREGFRVIYSIQTPDNKMIPGQIDIAALPVRWTDRGQESFDKRSKQSLRMALFMLAASIKGLWFLQQLSPGYVGLMPFMLMEGTDKTISQFWSESAIMSNLLPPGDSEFIDGEYKAVK
ncbi:MAG: hypothetical protein WC341_00675 [Bacteroidales bacterium]|jgi:hypothetical protein